RFNKTAEQLHSLQDKWLYVFKHLHELDSIPKALHEDIFQRTFAIAQLAQFTPGERKAYEDSIKYYRDLKNAYDTAHQEGLEEGLEIGRQEGEEIGRAKGEQIGRAKGEQIGRLKGEQAGLAKGRTEGMATIVQHLHANGLSLETIVQMTGLSLEQVTKFLKNQ
ncbi:MAG: hypothetical protein CR991_07420, partial [Proteobacteria bacterium]